MLIMTLFPPLLFAIAVGGMTWIIGTLLPLALLLLLFVFGTIADEAAADAGRFFKGLDVVDMVMKFGVDEPSDGVVVVIAEAAFASSDPVRLLRAGTVVSCIAGVVDATCDTLATNVRILQKSR